MPHKLPNPASLTGLMLLFIALCYGTAFPCSAQLFEGLKAKIQKELDANPFLREEGVKLRVASEENGYVKLEMYEGNRKAREVIGKGIDILSISLDINMVDGVSSEGRRTVTVLRRAIDQITQIDGVKQIILDAVINTPLDRGVDADTEKDYVEAAKWYEIAAEQGNATAQNNLGVMYGNGQGVQQDYQKAMEWYRKAAEQGHADAQHNLGLFYYNGSGVQQDYQKAMEWYRKAAEQGNATAQNNLGVLY